MDFNFNYLDLKNQSQCNVNKAFAFQNEKKTGLRNTLKTPEDKHSLP